MDYTLKKSTCEMYEIRWPGCGWALITIDEARGMFNCQSDYGNYAYNWPNHGRESFKHFLVEITKGDCSYLLNKVSDCNYLNYEATIKSWEKALIEIWKDHDCTREQFRAAWDFIHDLDDYQHNVEFLQIKTYENSELCNICSEPWEVFDVVKEYPPNAKAFAEILMPVFRDILEKEIAQLVAFQR